MDQGTLQGIGTILAMLAFASIVWWACRKDKTKDFEEAANLPFENGELDGDRQNGDQQNRDYQNNTISKEKRQD